MQWVIEYNVLLLANTHHTHLSIRYPPIKHNITLGQEYMEYKRVNLDVFKCVSSLKLSAKAAGVS